MQKNREQTKHQCPGLNWVANAATSLFANRFLCRHEHDPFIEMITEEIVNYFENDVVSYFFKKKCYRTYSLLPNKRSGGFSSEKRRVWDFVERERLPRERGDPKPRSVADFTWNNTSSSPSSRLIHPSSHPQRFVAIFGASDV